MVKFEYNRMIRNIHNFEPLTNIDFKTLEDISVAETIVECLDTNLKTTIFQRPKCYGSLTLVTRLKFVSNMADQFRHSDCILEIW